MERYYQKEIECASAEQIRAWQDERLVQQVRHVYDNVPYYRAKMEEKGVRPEDIRSRDDLHLLPFDGIADWKYNAERLNRCGFDGILTFELLNFSKSGRHDNDFYADLPLRQYYAMAYQRACRVAALRGLWGRR